MSHSILFVDLSSAFASLCREIVMREWDNDEQFIQVCIEQGVDAEIATSFIKYLNDHPILNEPNEVHIMQMIKQMHHHSWSTFEYVKGAIITKRGVLAGTPLAD